MGLICPKESFFQVVLNVRQSVAVTMAGSQFPHFSFVYCEVDSKATHCFSAVYGSSNLPKGAVAAEKRPYRKVPGPAAA
jgi:hypothetical protein